MNSEILDFVFPKLDNPTLKTARLVCSQWGNIGAVHLATRTYFNTSHMLPFDRSGTLPPFNKNLVKRVQVSFCSCKIPENNLLMKMQHDIMTKNFVSFCTQINKITEVLSVCINANFSMVPLMRSLCILDFPNMTELTLSEPEIPEEAILPNKFCTFPSRPNLMKLNVNLARENSPFGQVLQKLVDSAPNLLVLIISGNQTPSLAECKMLQVLKFRGTYKPEGEIMFSMNKLNGMLVAVKDTLVELVLQMDGVGGNFITGGQSYGADDKFSLPKMPLLTILTVIEVGVFTIENEWSSETVPMLKDLCLRSKRRFGVISCLSSLQSPHDCVESLDILGAETPDAIKYIKLTFPNMNKLEVGIVCPDFTDVNKCKNFKRRIEAFDKLERLELLKITISGINRFLYSLILLECISKINATILLRLQFTQSAYVDTFTQPAFETILELCKAMNKVTIEGLGLIPPIAKEVNNSIKSNNIPVNIIPKKIYGNIKIFHNGEFYDI